MYRSTNRELWFSFLAMGLIAAMYLAITAAWQSVPAASEFLGHSLGILGFVLMLMTETLYSLRKRTKAARWGRMAAWLEFHIFTGLVGSFMVLLHTSWKFNGLAGVVTLLTMIVVFSGFLGRYIYTALPRTADGAEVTAAVVARQINQTQDEIDAWIAQQPVEIQDMASRQKPVEARGEAFVLGRAFSDLADRLRWELAVRKMRPELRQAVRRLQRLIIERRRMRSQLASLTAARRMLSIWHAVHIPIGMALFTAAFVHIAGAIYFGTLLR